MRITKRQAKATSLDHAIELAKRHAKERRLPSKVMADLMGVELKTYYRWLLENTLPLNRIRPNDVWIGDGHSFKAKVQHPIHGQPFKPEVTVIIDGCTRMVVGFSFSLAESCVAVADALRIGIKHNGVPLMYYSDNGGGQTGKTIDHEITGLTARLGIHHETGLPGKIIAL